MGAKPSRPIGLVLAGASGSGKTTQSHFLQEDYGFCHIEPRKLIGEEIASGSHLGVAAARHLGQMEEVPLEVVMEMLKGRLEERDCQKGFVLADFPQTLGQAESLDEMLDSINRKVDLVGDLYVHEAEAKRRCARRLNHPGSHRVYNTRTNPPADKGLDNATKEPLVRSSGDANPYFVQKRFERFTARTLPVVSYYRTSNRVHTIDGQQPIENVREDMRGLVEKVRAFKEIEAGLRNGGGWPGAGAGQLPPPATSSEDRGA